MTDFSVHCYNLYSYMNGSKQGEKLLAQCLRFFGENCQKLSSNLALSLIKKMAQKIRLAKM